jgi:N-formylmaleamate deformylase
MSPARAEIPTIPDIARTYRRAGFGHTVERGDRPALLVVDLTRGFTESQFPLGADLAREVAATARLVVVAHELHVPVVFTVITFRTENEGRVWRQKAPGLSVLTEGSEAVRVDPRLPISANDDCITKSGASAFFGTALAPLLFGMRVNTLVVCGATTSGCVRASVVDAVQYGFPVLIPAEAVGDRASGPHEAALFDLDQKYADITTEDDVADYLRRPRGHAPPATIADGKENPQ